MIARALRLLLAAVFLAVAASAAQEKAGIVGDWLGSLDVGTLKLRLVLHVTRGDDGTWRGTLDSIDQNASGIPIDVLTFDGNKLHAELHGINGIYDATIDEAATTLTGTWTQRGVALTLNMTRTEDAASLVSARPQEPKPPFPYSARDVTFTSGDVTLAGTLTTPSTPGPHVAVVLISGSGPQNRDEAILGHKPFLVLADHLTRKGIAVLRYDDRGVAKSTGQFETATTQDFASDAAAAVQFLKSLPEIDAQRIGLVGHSEGGIVAPMVAADSKDVAFVVLLAGVGVPIDELLRAQRRLLLKANGASELDIERTESLNAQMFAAAKSVTDPAAREKRLREVTQAFVDSLPPDARNLSDEEKASLERGVQMLSTPWMQFLLSYDPAATLRRVKVPVLAINGELDLQVPPAQNLPVIKQALAAGGNRDVTVSELPKLNHLFQTATTGAPSEYGAIEETMSPVALNAVSEWIGARALRAKK
jgi:pimeloyl-ACP methyl ester carboxylesterase